jgi:hypothetical protein
LIVERNRLAGGVIHSEWLVHQTVTDALPSSESRSFGNDLVAQKPHLEIVSVQNCFDGPVMRPKRRHIPLRMASGSQQLYMRLMLISGNERVASAVPTF